MKPGLHTESEFRKKVISKDGASLVEFAFVVVIFFMVIFGIIDLGRGLFMYHHVGNAAREGSRFAIVHGSTSLSPASATDVSDYVKSISPLDANNVIVTTTWDPDNMPGSRVKVQVQYNFISILPIWFGSGIPMASTSQMVISY